MRVGVVSTSYPREAGDPAGNFVAGFARWLATQDVDVEVVAAGPGAAVVDGIAVHRVPGMGLFYEGGAPERLAAGRGAWLTGAAFTAALALEVARRAGGWEAAVSHWVLPSALAVEAAFARDVQGGQGERRPRRRHLAIAHSSDVWMLRRSMVGRGLLRALAGRADLVYAAAHLVVEGAPGRVVAMGVEALDGGDRARGRARYLLHRSSDGSGEKAGPVALFIGRLVPIKGVDLLLAALPPGMSLLVAGDGPERAALERAAAALGLGARVRFVGEVRGEARRDLYAAADLLVVPSQPQPDGREEGTPTVLYEALVAGLPILASRCGGVEDALSGKAGTRVVDPGAEALASGLRAFLHEPFERPDVDAAHAYCWQEVGPRLAGELLQPCAAGRANLWRRSDDRAPVRKGGA